VSPFLFLQLLLTLLYCKHAFQIVLTSVLRKPKKLVGKIHPLLCPCVSKSNMKRISEQGNLDDSVVILAYEYSGKCIIRCSVVGVVNVGQHFGVQTL